MDDDIITKGMDEVQLRTLKFVVESLEKYPVRLVISTLKEHIEKLEKK